jgi:hypothetical protein
MSGHISMGPFLPHGEATGSMTVTTVSLPGGILDLTQTPFTFWSPSPFHLTFDPKGPLWSEAGGDFEAPAVAWGPLYTKAFNEIIRPHWTSLVWSPESPEELPTEAVGITFQVLFSCDKVVPALDAVDCTADRPAPEDDPSSCLTDGMWVGPVRYPRSVIQGACEALVAEHVGRIEGTLVELAALPVQGLTGAGRLVAEVCPDGTRLCGFSAAPDWQLESTGEPWVVRPTDAASLAAFREGDE